MTTDQRFVEACKKAAELRPDLFKWEEFPSKGIRRADNQEVQLVDIRFSMNGVILMRYGKINGEPFQSNTTQDDIDSMAAALGWEYEISRHIPDEPMERLHVGGWVYGFREIAEIRQHLGLMEYPDKLTAAKEAFIAIVEQIEKHSP